MKCVVFHCSCGSIRSSGCLLTLYSLLRGSSTSDGVFTLCEFRFKKNNFTVEKNPTLVRFPLKGLDMKDWVHPSWHNINEHTK